MYHRSSPTGSVLEEEVNAVWSSEDVVSRASLSIWQLQRHVYKTCSTDDGGRGKSDGKEALNWFTRYDPGDFVSEQSRIWMTLSKNWGWQKCSACPYKKGAVNFVDAKTWRHGSPKLILYHVRVCSVRNPVQGMFVSFFFGTFPPYWSKLIDSHTNNLHPWCGNQSSGLEINEWEMYCMYFYILVNVSQRKSIQCNRQHETDSQ